MISIESTGKDNRKSTLHYDKYVDECPFCHNSIQPIILNAFINKNIDEVTLGTLSRVINQCPRNDCENIFIGIYRYGEIHQVRSFKLLESYPEYPTDKTFGGEINGISPNFVNIYNQASSAEQYNLQLIAGPGYRKSLEFLIKDYALTKSDETKKDEILQKPLGDVIKLFIDDSRIKPIAKRASWLGNDETHYLRKWEGKDLEELKILIQLTVNWIENVELSDKFVNDMPEN